ncbi:phosphoglycerate mutase-like protein [Dothidotthia symphoricarpi CBS 119687]|uniref:Phosphoglycerate mutase-like protein n=1 Tax=Dothidotthia symphoricarpi CBS 119687 TaxID=1392245 RepID=A0A6A6AH19_9PLEO|nr:phosphoglycerate mutase-like protein [Dothidotthia symphoricarpi CBS 119687]KAF2131239.1 phosphoglycerate mutase-like protein [Dothidotthia symphoricarpi CBS 119687]
MPSVVKLLVAVFAVGSVTGEDFNILHHLGGNGQWFPGPEVTGLSSEVPAGCQVDMAAFFSRHGSRYPDTGAYNEWLDLYQRIQAAGTFNVTDKNLDFLKTWKPVLLHPERQIAHISPTGYKELHDMGSTWRLRYPDLYEYNSPFTMWANWYKSSPRVRDSARLYAQGFVGPNATDLTTIYALNSSDPTSWMNSLATSDLCKAYNDEGGSPYKDQWDAIYLPPIRSRLNAKIQGSFNFTQWEVSIIPYLCGFETQITGHRSPFCELFTEKEILQYEYAQDLRYWYGNGLGSDIERYQMLPIVEMVAQRFIDGPNATYNTGNSSFVPPKIMAAFSNDGQINQIIAALGVFDDEPQLPGNTTVPNRKFRASRLVPMRGTVAFERLFCPAGSLNSTGGYTKDARRQAYMRIRLNEVVYPVVGCTDGPGLSCPLEKYQSILQGKLEDAGSFTKLCNVTNPEFSSAPSATFFMDNTLSYATVIKP